MQQMGNKLMARPVEAAHLHKPGCFWFLGRRVPGEFTAFEREEVWFGSAIRSPIPCLVHNIGSNNSKSAQRKHCCFSMASVGGRWGFELDASLSRVVWHASANSVLK